MTVDRLTALERLMLGASKTWPQDIGALVLLDAAALLDAEGGLLIETIRRAIEARLHLVPRLRQVVHTPRRGLGGPVWIDDPGFDISHHVGRHEIDHPGGEIQLIDAVETLRRQPLDPTRPMWELWFLTGLQDGRVALFARIHHTIADGVAAMTTIGAFLDATPDTPIAAPPPWRPAPPPSALALAVDNVAHYTRSLGRAFSMVVRARATVRRLGEAWPAVREVVAEEPSTATSLNRMVGPGRRLALLRAPLDAMSRAGNAHGATVNDVLLAATAGGLRSLLQRRGEPVDDTTLLAYVPVSLRRQRTTPQQGNQIAQMVVPLRLGEDDPIRRLRQIASETATRKGRTRVSLDSFMRGRILRRMVLVAVMRRRVNITTADIPGPPLPLYLAGAPILEVFPVLPLIANESLGVGALSYDGSLFIGIAADLDAYPDLDVLASGMRDALRELETPIAAATSSRKD
jgi:diacylglycerol O-acyltransferase / wax synthase